MTRQESLTSKLKQALIDQGVGSGAAILIAYSGGPDSTALLYGLASLQTEQTFRLEAFYLDHGLRPAEELSSEYALITEHCNNLQIPLHTARLTGGQLREQARQAGRSLEEAARDIRHSYLTLAANTHNMDYIALGHTLDDNLETLIMRFFQGSGSGGLCGIPGRRGRLIRPLLACSKQELLAYLQTRGLCYSQDSSNTQADFLRNRMRRLLLPRIAEVFPGYRSSLENFATKNRDIHSFLAQSLAEQITWTCLPTGEISIPLREFQNLPRSLKLHLFYLAFNRIYSGSGKKLPFRFLKPIINTVFKKNTRFNGYGLAIFVKEDYLFFRADIVNNKKKGYLIEYSSECQSLDSTGHLPENGAKRAKKSGIIIRNSGIVLELSEGNGSRKIENSCYAEIALKKDIVSLPLIVRSKRAGDKISLKTFSKSLKKLWTEWGVPEVKRMLIPVIADRNGILAVAGKPFGYKNIVTPAHSCVQKDEKIIFIKIKEDGVKQSG